MTHLGITRATSAPRPLSTVARLGTGSVTPKARQEKRPRKKHANHELTPQKYISQSPTLPLPRSTSSRQRTHLVLPLAGHNLPVDARDGDVRVQARAVVRLRYAATVSVFEPDRAVVWALGSGLGVLRPPVGSNLFHVIRDEACR